MIEAHKLNLGTVDPVWSISGLTTLDQRQRIRHAILSEAAITSDSFNVAKDGNKLSLEHRTSKGMKLFTNESVLDLSNTIMSQKFLQLLSLCFRQSNSNFRHSAGWGFSSLRPIDLPRWRAYPNNSRYSSSWSNNASSDTSQTVGAIARNYCLAYDSVPFIPNMQFSIMRRGSYIPPHTDISNKIATLMIYLPSEKQSKMQLGTTFWVPQSINTLTQSESCFLKDSNLSMFRKQYQPTRTPFEGENAILFYRSNTSWHSFEFDGTLDDEPRVSININLLYPVSSKI